MSAVEPLVSIGLPVYNASPFLRGALDSLLAQTYEHIEVVISDNASTDDTEAICKRAAQADRRIRYVRNRINTGAAANFNQTFRLSAGSYFKFAAHDDLVAEEFVADCVEHLNRHPDVVLCFSPPVPIDEYGNITGAVRRGPRVDSARASDRFGVLLQHPFWATPLFGVARACALERTRLFGPYIADDHVLLSELSLLGRFHELPRNGYFQRSYPSRQAHKASPKARLAYSNPTRQNAKLPRVRLIDGYRRAVDTADLSLPERVRCYLSIARWVSQRASDRLLPSTATPRPKGSR